MYTQVPTVAEEVMLKLLVLFPLMLVGGALVMGLALPLLALLPLALALGAGVLALVVVFAVFGLVLRVFAGLLIGAGVLVTAGLGFGLLFAGGAMVIALGFALAHLLVPILLIVGIVWLIRRGSQPRPALPLQH